MIWTSPTVIQKANREDILSAAAWTICICICFSGTFIINLRKANVRVCIASLGTSICTRKCLKWEDLVNLTNYSSLFCFACWIYLELWIIVKAYPVISYVSYLFSDKIRRWLLYLLLIVSQRSIRAWLISGIPRSCLLRWLVDNFS